MSLITFCSASGSPGVTTSALGVAMHWGRRVLIVEADVAGSDILTGHLRGEVRPHGGIMALALARSRSQSWAIDDYLLPLTNSVDVLTGIDNPAQARGLGSFWPDLRASLTALESAGTDVLIDLGRMSLPDSDPRWPLIEAADLRLVLTRTRATEAIATARLARQFADDDRATQSVFARTAMIVIKNGTYGVREVSSLAAVPRVATLPWDPTPARALSDGAAGPKSKFLPSRLDRAIASAARAIDARVQARSEQLASGL